MTRSVYADRKPEASIVSEELEWNVPFDTPDHGLPPKHVFRRVPDVEVTQARRREQNRVLKREARQRMTPEQREQQRASDRERKKTARLNATPEQRAREQERERERECNRPRRCRLPRKLNPEQRERRREKARQRSGNRLRPFWGVGGEGAGTDDKGRQPYSLLAASGPGADEHRRVRSKVMHSRCGLSLYGWFRSRRPP